MVTPTAICMYPISPTYLPFHRYLYYASLALSTLYPTPPPFVKGAFAYSLTYAATTSLYAILLVSLPKSSLINLDLFALWSILSAACICLLPLLSWNRNLNSANANGKSARSIVRIWGIWVGIGMICSVVTIARTKRLVANSGGNVGMTEASCLAAAESAKDRFKLRNPTTILLGEYGRVFGHLGVAVVTVVLVLVLTPFTFGLISCLITIYPSPPKVHSDDWTGLGESSEQGSFSTLSGIKAGYLMLRRVALFFSPWLFVVILVLNERFLLRRVGLPEAEEMYEVGQWGLLVGLGLVAAAAAIDWVTGLLVRSVAVEGLGKQDGGDVGIEIIV